MKRRNFIKTTGMATAGIGIAANAAGNSFFNPPQNSLPRWRGFNLLDYFSPQRSHNRGQTTNEEFKWMSDWGFDFVRIPMAYPRYVKFDPSKNITPEEVLNFDEKVVEEVYNLVEQANKHGLHVSLDLHRAPGFCVNAGFNEPYNLWQDKEAQEAFYAHWKMWAKTFAEKSRDQISFDLVNEPCTREDMNDQFSQRGPVPGDLYREVVLNCMHVIHKHNPERIIVADGNNVGSDVIPEIFDLDVGQSCRGYYPHYISHYRASWVFENPDDSPEVVWPGVIDGQNFSRKSIEDFYAPWIDAVKQGVGVHCGECGCYNKTPHDVFLAWFEDVLSVLTENQIGWGLWEFKGTFGLLNSGRKDVDYEDWYGYKLDRKLLSLLQKY
ncbi:Aryl-phospho-beta-D-glucosidase BglC, GH1 family [Tangfeifania diversioriginum]|uniref:Aryl-phospho-beta-D-glucosidase BglC, GH1 family n=1 Tax=Tangfeifania diversioriginum TaxID=1168035 RepID=A0A1M6N3N8_9BACT|nr:cellulase family glycosylhydrolase [Tangfeifania diversioriginum]SHJ90304.1 Aryl-phospho-beta-D-glucosidase BglC, GH1 family [Tangfeifania diversioriginum]